MPRLHTVRTLLALGGVLLAVGSIGCSSPEKSEITVARVGDRTITLDYFELKMNQLDPRFVPSDIDTEEGRKEVLDILINKEVMALKAEQLGMDSDGTADQQATMVSKLKAVTRMREDVAAPANEVTEEEIFEYYENFPRTLLVSYMLFEYEDEAVEAKRLVEGGEDWNTVAKRLEAGAPNTKTSDYTLRLRYGTTVDDLEQKVFQLPVGQVSDPIDSIYGWFLVRVDEVTMERVPPLDEIRDKVIESVRKQESELLTYQFINEVFDKYDLQINEDAIRIVFENMPDDEPLSPPTPRENLQDLVIDSQHYDTVLISYADKVIDLGEYVQIFNESSVFARPRHERGAGHFRRMLKEDAIRYLMPIEAEARGYMDDPVVQDEYKLRKEQAMVNRLHAELIADEVEVTAADVEAYWEENAHLWKVPARREILALVASTEADAVSARIDAVGGMPWPELVERYCIESDIKQKQGRFGLVTEASQNPFADIAWSMQEEGELSQPVKIDEGQWALVRLERIMPAEDPTLEEVRVQVGQRAKAHKEDEFFQTKVAEWRQDFDIQTWPEHLMKVTYDPEPRNESIPVTVGNL